ncbi:MAG: gamma-glutamyltransferase [Candidatus Lokiarchaeota archaeon]|nr:gamma-glutamyltransferase [Candidatus Lokiarchaeota archaeon]
MKFNDENLFSFNSHRSCLYTKHGVVGASQPLAAEVGLSILKSGGNAADAAVASAAVLNVVEPMSTGAGGDCFCLFYDNSHKKVVGLNGSGRAPKYLSFTYLQEVGIDSITIPSTSPHAITVPGAVAGWIDTLSQFGTMDISEVLKPAIKIAEEGFPVSPFISIIWKLQEFKLKRAKYGFELLINRKSPKIGQIFKNPHLATVFREIAEHGKAGFYSGWVAEEIINIINEAGGVMTQEDLKNHSSKFVDPISTTYRGLEVHQIPPNGQGLTLLIALNLLEQFNLVSMGPDSISYLHLLIECLRLAFADSRYFVSDPDHQNIPIQQLLSKTYALERKSLIDQNKASLFFSHGLEEMHSDTVYIATADSMGNACSFINSNYESFGTGIIPRGTGFVLQNRGSCFTLIQDHPNVVAPEKRPYHTIIPGMVTKNKELFACYGIMGGFNQPQAHLQVLSKLIDFHFDPQSALDALRFSILGGNPSGIVAVEKGEAISSLTIEKLQKMGHEIKVVDGIGRTIFGNGQVIMRDDQNDIYISGSDPRSDGCVIGY